MKNISNKTKVKSYNSSDPAYQPFKATNVQPQRSRSKQTQEPINNKGPQQVLVNLQ